MREDGDVIEIDVLEILRYMVKRWYVFILVMAITLGAGMAVCCFVITPQYESTTKIIVLNRQDSNTLTYNDMQLASQLTKDYEELIVSRDVLEPVIKRYSLDYEYEEFVDRVSVENVADTRIISITVEDPSPEMARRIANSIRDTAADHIRSVTDVEAVNIAEEANLAEEPSSPSLLLWALLSAAGGFLIVFVIELIRYLSDDTFKSSDDVSRYLGLSTLALIPKVNTEGKSQGSGRKEKGSKHSAKDRR